MYLHTCTIYGDVSVTSTSRDLRLVLVVLICLSTHTGTYAPPHSYEIPSQFADGRLDALAICLLEGLGLRYEVV